MRTRFPIFVTWLWIASLFVATVGVSVRQIYCYCLGETSFSLFNDKGGCETPAGQAEKSCCATPAPKPHSCCNDENIHPKGKGCTRKTTRVFQLKTEYTFPEKNDASKPLAATDSFVVPAPLLPSPGFQPNGRSVALAMVVHPPPPVPGRIICLRHGAFRC